MYGDSKIKVKIFRMHSTLVAQMLGPLSYVVMRAAARGIWLHVSCRRAAVEAHAGKWVSDGVGLMARTRMIP